jgi:glucose-6-phosphate dehydrogenase assembly protein OpcA
MAIAYKVLGQQNPAASSATTLYTVPSSTSTVVSTITVCNQASTSATFSIAVQPAGASLVAKHYVNYQTVIPGNDTISLTIGITLAATDLISCTANTSTLSFCAFGSEIT